MDIIALYIRSTTKQKVYDTYLRTYFYFHGLKNFLLHSKFLIYFSYILFCLFGNISLFFFLTFLLIEISLENPSMKTVFKAISLNRK